MRLIRDLHQIDTQLAATIGNFDGVHSGHQALLETLTQQAKQLNLPSALITFEPSPQEFFLQNDAPARLTNLREKIALLNNSGIDYLILLPFSQRLANLSAEQFVQQILQQQLRIKFLLVGDDFQFGKNRRGNFALLKSFADQKNFLIHKMPTQELQAERISSTRIREALATGDLATAERLLGRPYSMLGKVVRGHQRGRTLGFPTANIFLKRHRSPVLGVYAAKIYGVGQRVITGVANVGNRPTVDGTCCLLEIHLFDFERDIYGVQLQVEFCHKIRPEQRFDSLELLRQQIELDVTAAKEYFSSIEIA